MEKVFVIFSERTQYAGNRIASVDEQMYPNFYLTAEDADAEISRIIERMAEVGDCSYSRHIIINNKTDIQHRFRIAELKRA